MTTPSLPETLIRVLLNKKDNRADRKLCYRIGYADLRHGNHFLELPLNLNETEAGLLRKEVRKEDGQRHQLGNPCRDGCAP